MNSQPEVSEGDILTLFRLRTELQKKARRILQEIKRIEETITKIDTQRRESDTAVVARMRLARAKRLGQVGARGGGTDSTARIHTPVAFRDLLLGIALSTPNTGHEPRA